MIRNNDEIIIRIIHVLSGANQTIKIAIATSAYLKSIVIVRLSSCPFTPNPQ